MLVKTLCALTLCAIGVALAEKSPVFLWGANSASQPSLQTFPQSEFGVILSDLLKDHMIVAFQENGLTNKDFLCVNLESSDSCYARLQTVSPKTYYSSIENPFNVLHLAAADREFNSVNQQGQLANEVECLAGKAVFVTFDDAASQPRELKLESHDTAIAAVMKQLSCKVAYLYMAAPNTANVASTLQHRLRRDAEVPVGNTAAPKGGVYFRQGNQFLIFFQTLTLVQGKTNTALKITGMGVTNSSSTKFSVSLNADNGKAVTFDITSTSDGYYTLSNVVYDSVIYRSQNINSLTTFSYFCGSLILSAAPPSATEPSTSSLVFQSLQFQAPFNAATKETFVFGDAWHCVGFFTPGILGGLFIVVLLLIILLTGLCWIMDMNTMDRFDDPKGKTITINASE